MLDISRPDRVQPLDAADERGELLGRERGNERIAGQPAVDDCRIRQDGATLVQPERLRRDVQVGCLQQAQGTIFARRPLAPVGHTELTGVPLTASLDAVERVLAPPVTRRTVTPRSVQVWELAA